MALALLIAAVAAGCARRHDERMESSTAPPPQPAYGTNGQAYDRGARPQSDRLRAADHGRASDRYAAPTTRHHAAAAAPVRSADRRLAGRVRRTLAANKQTGGLHVAVRAQGGVVTLSGHVATRAQKRKAAALAEHVAGVKHVRNAITVGGHAAR